MAKREIYELNLFYEANVVTVYRRYPAPMRSYENVTQQSKNRIEYLALKYTYHYDAFGRLRIINL